MIDIIYQDADLLVCIKPAGVRSTDEPGGLPSLLRETLGNPKADVRTVHRLDQVVSGLMVLARNARTASELSRQIREDQFQKEYQAVVHGHLPCPHGTMTDLLLRSKEERKTYVVQHPEKGVQEAILDYRVLDQTDTLSKVAITLRTGRTHQIRCQFSSRGLPLVGDRKYSLLEDGCPIALWSCRLGFTHPTSGQAMSFFREPPAAEPWNLFLSSPSHSEGGTYHV